MASSFNTDPVPPPADTADVLTAEEMELKIWQNMDKKFLTYACSYPHCAFGTTSSRTPIALFGSDCCLNCIFFFLQYTSGNLYYPFYRMHFMAVYKVTDYNTPCPDGYSANWCMSCFCCCCFLSCMLTQEHQILEATKSGKRVGAGGMK